MKQLFCDYETSTILKKLGFDEPCFAFYISYSGELEFYPTKIEDPQSISAPLYQQAKEWLFEKYNIWIITISWRGTKKYDYRCWNKEGAFLEDRKSYKPFDSYIVAENEGVKRTVQHLNSSKK